MAFRRPRLAGLFREDRSRSREGERDSGEHMPARSSQVCPNPVPVRMWQGRAPVPVRMWQKAPVPVQMWAAVLASHAVRQLCTDLFNNNTTCVAARVLTRAQSPRGRCA